MRLIVFGTPDRDTALLERDDVRAGIREIVANGGWRGAPPHDAVAAGLFAPHAGIWGPGARLHVPARAARERSVAAGLACAEVIASHHDGIRSAYEHWSAAVHRWPDVALLVLGGLLLDLFVGQALVEAGMARPPRGRWRAWALPPAGVAVGMRLRYDRDRSAGCAVMWEEGRPDEAVLLTDSELRDLLAGMPGRRPDRRLRLRYLGWLRGDEPAYLLLRSTDTLWSALRTTAREVVARAHSLLPRVGGQDGHVALACSRLALERALERLQQTGVVEPSHDGTVRRVVWTGPDWALRAASMARTGDVTG